MASKKSNKSASSKSGHVEQKKKKMSPEARRRLRALRELVSMVFVVLPKDQDDKAIAAETGLSVVTVKTWRDGKMSLRGHCNTLMVLLALADLPLAYVDHKGAQMSKPAAALQLIGRRAKRPVA